jgi:hypothetical protein
VWSRCGLESGSVQGPSRGAIWSAWRLAVAASADCKKQQAADAAKFAKDYENFGQCVKAGKAENGDDEDDD